jgi:hypothetical protein
LKPIFHINLVPARYTSSPAQPGRGIANLQLTHIGFGLALAHQLHRLGLWPLLGKAGQRAVWFGIGQLAHHQMRQRIAAAQAKIYLGLIFGANVMQSDSLAAYVLLPLR